MRLSLRLILPAIISIALVSGLFAYFQAHTQENSLRQGLEQRAIAAGESLGESVLPLLEKDSPRELQRAMDRFTEREHLAGAAVFNKEGTPLAVTHGFSDSPAISPPISDQAIERDEPRGEFFSSGKEYFHVCAIPLHSADGAVFGLVILNDAAYIRGQSVQIWRDTMVHVSLEILLIVLITLLIVRWSVASPVARTIEWMKALRAGRPAQPLRLPRGDLFRPLAQEMENFAKSMESARASAERETQLREAGESLWTADRLGVHVRKKLQERRLVVVSNREPYIHTRQGKSVEVMVPASGLVTAIEPILRACEGTWIAHGSGDADRETVDERNRLRVPPDEPQYTLRRVWLNKKEEGGYYFGFANEGLWPLCHIAHTRPIFRSENWEHYQAVNRKFADAVLDEIAGTSQPCILVQDYHFALLPRLIKEQRPDARVAIFWHIPWPNPEAFGICPWERELLDGLLGADLVGFQIQAHCNNFLETVDHALESRIEWERFAVNRGGHFTLVRPFPISIGFEEKADATASLASPGRGRKTLLAGLGVEAAYVGVGVDRVDYTKGILERFHGVERFLEKYPAYQGRFTFVQIGAPSRLQIKRYHDLYTDVEAEADRIGRRFQKNQWKPIVLLKRHHSHQEINRFYHAADFCLVTSLHDGMNLVAKEFAAARSDEQGVLILSRFAGACRELRDALIVNPYDTEQIAESIREALEMDPEEARQRMQGMRKIVREHNIYRWAGNLITELSDIRLEGQEASRVPPEVRLAVV